MASALALLVSVLVGFSLVALFMARNHTWTDSITATLPLPGGAVTLASDPSLATQVRIASPRAWATNLGDQTRVLVAQADVINDALVPIRRITIAGELRRDGRLLTTRSAVCGKELSPRLLRRLRREELTAFELIDVSSPLDPGDAKRCQLVFPDIGPGAQEVLLRVISVEPYPGHPPPAFLP